MRVWGYIPYTNTNLHTNQGRPSELPPLHMMIEAEDQMGIYRLTRTQQCRPKYTKFSHTKQYQDLEQEPILQIGSDMMLPRYA
jgi:hypothetical protein